MTGWNMPPGCNVSDIPGNRPEDQEAEAITEVICNILSDLGVEIESPKTDVAVDKLLHLIGDTYSKGYHAGIADERFATECEKE